MQQSPWAWWCWVLPVLPLWVALDGRLLRRQSWRLHCWLTSGLFRSLFCLAMACPAAHCPVDGLHAAHHCVVLQRRKFSKGEGDPPVPACQHWDFPAVPD